MMSKGISQTVLTSDKDSITCIPTIQLKKAINIIEQAKVMKEELYLKNHKIFSMDSLLRIKDQKVSEYQRKDSTNARIILAYKDIVSNLNKTVANGDLAYAGLNMKLAKEKTKKWATLVLGVGVGFLIFHH